MKRMISLILILCLAFPRVCVAEERKMDVWGKVGKFMEETVEGAKEKASGAIEGAKETAAGALDGAAKALDSASKMLEDAT